MQTAEVDGDLHVLPRSAMPYLAAGVVDRDLFNVTQLIEYGYDDASVDATPIIVEYADGPTTSQRAAARRRGRRRPRERRRRRSHAPTTRPPHRRGTR